MKVVDDTLRDDLERRVQPVNRKDLEMLSKSDFGFWKVVGLEREAQEAQEWKELHTDETDYRINDLVSGLRQAAKAARLLADDTHSPEFFAALEGFKASGEQG